MSLHIGPCGMGGGIFMESQEKIAGLLCFAGALSIPPYESNRIEREPKLIRYDKHFAQKKKARKRAHQSKRFNRKG